MSAGDFLGLASVQCSDFLTVLSYCCMMQDWHPACNQSDPVIAKDFLMGDWPQPGITPEKKAG